jgi:hypothetical protein
MLVERENSPRTPLEEAALGAPLPYGHRSAMENRRDDPRSSRRRFGDTRKITLCLPKENNRRTSALTPPERAKPAPGRIPPASFLHHFCGAASGPSPPASGIRESSSWPGSKEINPEAMARHRWDNETLRGIGMQARKRYARTCVFRLLRPRLA